MAKLLMIERLARESILAQLERFDFDTNGIDEVGLRNATIDWLEGTHSEVVEMETRVLLERLVMAAIKDIIRKSRPTARQIAERYVSGQMQLPTFEQAKREVYRDADGLAIRLVDMRKEATFSAALHYLRLGDENRAKGGRLFKVWQEMDGRGLADEDTVRMLYSA
jgi:KaiC/GvpD/RAD55 family RecA-like ATPase